MSERNVFTCDGCGSEISTPQPAVTLFVDQRFAKTLRGGNYHCCSVACLITYADKLRDSGGHPVQKPIRASGT